MILLEVLFAPFRMLGYIPRLLIQVFVRKNFGTRYATLTACLLWAAFLAYLPYFFWKLTFQPSYDMIGRRHYEEINAVTFWKAFIGGYIYLAIFVVVAFKRRMETSRNSRQPNYKRTSRYSGDINFAYYTFGRPKAKRQIAALKDMPAKERDKAAEAIEYNSLALVQGFLEPAPFFILGLLMIHFGQLFGYVLCACAVVYSFQYLGEAMGNARVRENTRDEMLNAQMTGDYDKRILSELNLGHTERTVTNPFPDEDGPTKTVNIS